MPRPRPGSKGGSGRTGEFQNAHDAYNSLPFVRPMQYSPNEASVPTDFSTLPPPHSPREGAGYFTSTLSLPPSLPSTSSAVGDCVHGGCSVHVWLADGDWLAAGRPAQSHTHAAAAAVHRCTPCAAAAACTPCGGAAAAAVGWTGKKKCSGGREREERGGGERIAVAVDGPPSVLHNEARDKITSAAAFSDITVFTAHA